MNYRISSFTIGFFIWLAATIVFRVYGQYFFLPESSTVLALLYLLVIPVLGFATYFVTKIYHLQGLQPALSACLLVLPGMLADTLVILFFDQFLPNLPMDTVGPFASWLMWAYTIVIAVGVILSKHR